MKNTYKNLSFISCNKNPESSLQDKVRVNLMIHFKALLEVTVNKTKTNNKKLQIGKKETKPFLLIDDMLCYVKIGKN